MRLGLLGNGGFDAGALGAGAWGDVLRLALGCGGFGGRTAAAPARDIPSEKVNL